MPVDVNDLQTRVESLPEAVADIKNDLRSCLVVANDPSNAFFLARKVAEAIAKRVIEQLKRKPPKTFDACLQELESPEQRSRGLVPAEILTLLHNVRIFGNKCGHDDLQIDLRQEDVRLVLGPVVRVVEWYVEEFDRGPKLHLRRRRRFLAKWRTTGLIGAAAVVLVGLGLFSLRLLPSPADPGRPASALRNARVRLEPEKYDKTRKISRTDEITVVIDDVPPDVRIEWSVPKLGKLNRLTGNHVKYIAEQVGTESLTALVSLGEEHAQFTVDLDVEQLLKISEPQASP